MTARSALEHPWITGELRNNNRKSVALRALSLDRQGSIETTTLNRLQTYSKTSQLRKAILYAYVNFLP